MTNIYARKSHWKWYLAAGAVVIVMISLAYTRFLAQRLSERERQQAEQFAEALRQLSKPDLDSDCDLSLQARIIQNNTTIPVVLLDESNQIQEYRNIDDRNLDSLPIPEVRAALEQMVRQGADTIRIVIPPNIRKTLIYTHSSLLDWLRWYPIIQLCLIAAFIAFGYLGFSAARRAEENQVWLGMAKETAHQLGTPITAILGWVETLKMTNEDNADTIEMLDELRNDVDQLELVADRFSKIGATPELRPTNLYQRLERCREYIQKRAPRRVTFEFPDPNSPPLMVGLNAHLFDWVIENLLRNAIDAMEDGSGHISATIYEEGKYACIDISDTGKGIPSGKFKTVFKPGYSTKTRGWGLGLSLSKRIVEQYHRGKILVKRSEVGKGTTFTVKINKC